ncbi:acetyl-CoA carboxylase biotin carboxylase subunit [bacterium]|nr:MAG: acetyl-CoA carboxylase biotin carboxylase subunit [bacterium]
MVKKLLIANRGEIALRIIRACRELGIQTVAVYSKADELSLHTKFADEAICIGPNESAKSYLNIPSILAAVELTNADSIHPGYGFLSESAKFASICDDNNIKFIGSSSETINLMGNKSLAKDTMKKVGVPIIPGSDGNVDSLEQAKYISESMGYPVIIKAASGGGGKGMRLVNNDSELSNAYEMAKIEAEAAFSDANVYIEKFLKNPRHIEIQVICDGFGNVICLGERECSLQRRHQKILEESPSCIMNDSLRNKLYESSIKACNAVNYVGAGTIEYLVDDEFNYYFMEMNTRIQVEHPVTEMVLGIDLIKNQILCHSQIPLPDWMKDMKLRGHSIECRINAEDPEKSFMPSPGLINSFHMPGGNGIRVDTHAYSGYYVPQYYDSMIAKLIVHAPTRREAISRMESALNECVVEGIKTTIPFLKNIISNPDFINGDIHTGFIDKLME